MEVVGHFTGGAMPTVDEIQMILSDLGYTNVTPDTVHKIMQFDP